MGDVNYPQYGYQAQNITSPNATTYWAIAGVTSLLTGNNQSGDGLVVGPDIWVTTVKCNARMQYQVSRCQWDGTRMTKCTDTPGANTTELDVEGLDQLGDYLNALPVAIAMQNNFMIGEDTVTLSLTHSFSSKNRAPTVTDFTNMYGLVASSMVLDMSNGYYGTATVPTENTSSHLVYTVRVPWLLVVDFIVFACISQLLHDIISSHWNKSPIREMLFIAVATATRGKWWDNQLEGLCAAPQKELRRKTTDEVTFGVIASNDQYIDLEPHTTRIAEKKRYKG